MALSIIELLEQVGVDRVRVQPLMEVLTNVRSRKRGGTEVSFMTDSSIFAPFDVLDTPRNVGLIVWLPEPDVARVRSGINQAGVGR